MARASRISAVCFDWGGTLMSEAGPAHLPMCEWADVQAVAGAEETLRALYGRYPLCIATNASLSTAPMVERALDRVRLLRYVSRVFCCAELGVRKESPVFWRAVADSLGVSASSLAMIGDTLEADVLAPRGCGVFSVWFNEGGRKPVMTVSVTTVTRLPEFVGLVDHAA